MPRGCEGFKEKGWGALGRLLQVGLHGVLGGVSAVM